MFELAQLLSSPSTGVGASEYPGSGTKACLNRVFLIVHCHPGWDKDLGDTLKNSATTHEKEVQANAFPLLPRPEFNKSCDTTITLYCNNIDNEGVIGVSPSERPSSKAERPHYDPYTRTLASVIKDQRKGSIAYLAIFAHSAQEQIIFHHSSGSWTNLDGTNVNVLLADRFVSNPQVRLFGCYAGFGSTSIAQIVADKISGADVYAYNWPLGSIGTNDRNIGHGKKAVPINPPNPKQGDTWFVAFTKGKKSQFEVFRAKP